MDPLRFAIAATPLGVYFLMMGVINLRRRPFLTTGARDIATLGIGIVGLIIVGPMELFFPEAASRQWGSLVWILLLIFYGLCISLAVLLMRPRIVIYNAKPERVRATLSEFATDMDPSARWVGESLIMPNIHVHLNLESGGWLNNVQLAAVGARQDMESWRQLEKRLKAELKSNQMSPNLIGLGFLASAILLAGISTAWMIVQKQEIAQAVVDFLRL